LTKEKGEGVNPKKKMSVKVKPQKHVKGRKGRLDRRLPEGKCVRAQQPVAFFPFAKGKKSSLLKSGAFITASLARILITPASLFYSFEEEEGLLFISAPLGASTPFLMKVRLTPTLALSPPIALADAPLIGVGASGKHQIPLFRRPGPASQSSPVVPRPLLRHHG